jgi:hypothetical protein
MNGTTDWHLNSKKVAQGHHHKRVIVGCCGPGQNKKFVPYNLHSCALTVAEHNDSHDPAFYVTGCISRNYASYILISSRCCH